MSGKYLELLVFNAFKKKLRSSPKWTWLDSSSDMLTQNVTTLLLLSVLFSVQCRVSFQPTPSGVMQGIMVIKLFISETDGLQRSSRISPLFSTSRTNILVQATIICLHDLLHFPPHLSP